MIALEKRPTPSRLWAAATPLLAVLLTLLAGGLLFAALGKAARTLSADELKKRAAFRRRMVARRPMRKGERLTAGDVEFKRPGTGIQPDELTYVVGRPLARDVAAEDELEWQDLG